MAREFPRELAKTYVSFGVDDALSFRRADEAPSNARLIGWQCGFEPMFVAVWSYLGHRISDEDAIEIATDALIERRWFADGPTEPDHII